MTPEVLDLIRYIAHMIVFVVLVWILAIKL